MSFRARRLRLHQAPPSEVAALAELLTRASHRYGTRAWVATGTGGDLLEVVPSACAPTSR